MARSQRYDETSEKKRQSPLSRKSMEKLLARFQAKEQSNLGVERAKFATGRDTNEERNALFNVLLAAKVGESQAATRDRHVATIVELLKFEALQYRYEAIPRAHRQTFDWMFSNDQNAVESSPHCSNFSKWLLSEEKIYWVSGKPGAGKSTLMKFLFQEERTQALARQWSDSQAASHLPLHMASFYFWISGTSLQKSKEGMLRSLLYQMTGASRMDSEKTDLIAEIFRDRMQRCEVFGGDLSELTVPELTKALNTLLERKDRCFVLFLDGLDEFEGDSDHMTEMIRSLSENEFVKLCVASRPLTAFTDAFGTIPKLCIEYLTKRDILKYVEDHFAESRHFLKLEKFKPEEAESLKNAVADKAHGVFLWVYVVVNSLKEGLRDGDDLIFLRKRLDKLPAELTELFERIFNDLDPAYASQASEIFQFHRAYPEDSTLLGLHLSWTPMETAIQQSMSYVSPNEAQFYAETLRDRLYSRCKCFLEVSEPCSPWSNVRYLHRTARDYLESADIWNRIVSYQAGYKPSEAVSISRLMVAKAYEKSVGSGQGVVAIERLYKALAGLVFSQALTSIADIQTRIAFLDAVHWSGTRAWEQSREGTSWIHALTEREVDARKAAWPFLYQAKSDFTSASDIAICAEYDWYIQPKAQNELDLLSGRVDGSNRLTFAARCELFSVQLILLDAGLDPNQHQEYEASAWETFLGYRWIHQSQPLWRTIIELLIKYLEKGADLDILVTPSGNAEATYQPCNVRNTIKFSLKYSLRNSVDHEDYDVWDALEAEVWLAFDKAKKVADQKEADKRARELREAEEARIKKKQQDEKQLSTRIKAFFRGSTTGKALKA